MRANPLPLRLLCTEQINARARNLDTKSSRALVGLMNAEDLKVARAVSDVLREVARAVDLIVDALSRGGRLIYVGAGTSGRIAALDAVEIPPTFNFYRVQFVIAGGTRALGSASEISEDDVASGRKEIARRKPGKNDVVIGVATSGRTPFTVAAVAEARRRGAQTIALTCNPNSPLERAAHHAIVVAVGPEVLTGSSRMKAGTAHKMVLNMISTAAMIRLGLVYDNLMVHVEPKNSKLRDRAIRILEQTTGAGRVRAAHTLDASKNRTPVALVMLAAKVSREQASSALKSANGNVRQAIEFSKTLRSKNGKG